MSSYLIAYHDRCGQSLSRARAHPSTLETIGFSPEPAGDTHPSPLAHAFHDMLPGPENAHAPPRQHLSRRWVGWFRRRILLSFGSPVWRNSYWRGTGRRRSHSAGSVSVIWSPPDALTTSMAWQQNPACALDLRGRRLQDTACFWMEADRYATALLRNRDRLVKLAAQHRPQEFEQALLTAGAADGARLTPKARVYVINRGRAEMAEHISRLCMKNRRVSQEGAVSKVRAFVVHDYMGGFELSESIANAHAYDLLSARQRASLEGCLISSS